jgi:hypothetical protein
MEPVLLVRRETMGKYEYEFAARHFRVEESRVACRDCLVIGRYAVEPMYDELDRDLRLLGSRLVNPPEQHRWITSFSYYQQVRDFTPATWDEANIHECRHRGPFVVKGKTSSKKWQWKSHMFAKTKAAALKLAERLKEDAEIARQGVVYREYVPLRTFGLGNEEMPFTNEWRFYYLGDQRLAQAFYWSVSDYSPQAAITPEAIALGDRIASIAARFVTFFSLDLAETEDGRWILIEINDGQTAVPGEHDLDELYANLKTAAQAIALP